MLVKVYTQHAATWSGTTTSPFLEAHLAAPSREVSYREINWERFIRATEDLQGISLKCEERKEKVNFRDCELEMDRRRMVG